MIQAVLYDAEGHDRELELDDGLPALDDHQLLWIDLTGRDEAEIARLGKLLALKPGSLTDMISGGRAFVLANYGDYVHFDVAASTATSPRAARPSRRVRSAWTC